MAANETATKPIAAKSPRSGPLVILRRTFSIPAFLGAMLVAGVLLDLRVRLQNDASLPSGRWQATLLGGDAFWCIAAGQRPVFIDGRCDAYEPSGALSHYIRITHRDPAAPELLEMRGVHSCLIERSGPLCALLNSRPEWRRVRQDDLSMLFVTRRATP